jgi:hypothetical protein
MTGAILRTIARVSALCTPDIKFHTNEFAVEFEDYTGFLERFANCNEILRGCPSPRMFKMLYRRQASPEASAKSASFYSNKPRAPRDCWDEMDIPWLLNKKTPS